VRMPFNDLPVWRSPLDIALHHTLVPLGSTPAIARHVLQRVPVSSNQRIHFVRELVGERSGRAHDRHRRPL
jgi:hypothetical protein